LDDAAGVDFELLLGGRPRARWRAARRLAPRSAWRRRPLRFSLRWLGGRGAGGAGDPAAPVCSGKAAMLGTESTEAAAATSLFSPGLSAWQVAGISTGAPPR